MEITPATPRASADGGGFDDDDERGSKPNQGILGGFFRRRRRRRRGDDDDDETMNASTATSFSSRPRPTTSSSSFDDGSSSAFLLVAALLISVLLVAGLHWSALAGMERNLETRAATIVSSSSSSSSSSHPPLRVFSPSDLLASSSSSQENKNKEASILVAFAGEVFDVGATSRHYGPGGDYSHFAGRDATRAFATGDFDRDLTDEVGDLIRDPDSVQSLEHWLSFYGKHKEYRKVGVVGGGAFFDEKGVKKRARVELERAVEGWREEKRRKEKAKEM